MHRTVEVQFIGRTYDDFLFRPQAGVVASRRDIALRTRLSRRLSLELPVVSANMDSVTGSQMAKAMALEGGIGFVHRGMPIAAQVESVPLVKRTHSYVVEQPLCLPLHRIRGHLRAAVSYTGEETLVAARAKVLPDPLQYLIPLSPAAQAESYKR